MKPVHPWRDPTWIAAEQAAYEARKAKIAHDIKMQQHRLKTLRAELATLEAEHAEHIARQRLEEVRASAAPQTAEGWDALNGRARKAARAVDLTHAHYVLADEAYGKLLGKGPKYDPTLIERAMEAERAAHDALQAASDRFHAAVCGESEAT